MSPKPRNQGAHGYSGGSTPGVLLNLYRNWKIVKPKAINAVPVRTQDIKVRSMLMRVRSHEKCVSAVPLTSNLLVCWFDLSSGMELKYF
jgi:hypothetical protein